jgi:hypothetical protein
MVLRDIPREEWETFLDTFSHQHQGEPVTLAKIDIDDGLRVAERATPLKSVAHNRVLDHVSITVSEPPSGEVTHTVTQPDGIAIEEPGEAEKDPQLAVHVTGGRQHLVIQVATERP